MAREVLLIFHLLMLEWISLLYEKFPIYWNKLLTSPTTQIMMEWVFFSKVQVRPKRHNVDWLIVGWQHATKCLKRPNNSGQKLYLEKKQRMVKADLDVIATGFVFLTWMTEMIIWFYNNITSPLLIDCLWNNAAIKLHCGKNSKIIQNAVTETLASFTET